MTPRLARTAVDSTDDADLITAITLPELGLAAAKAFAAGCEDRTGSGADRARGDT